MAVRAAPRDPDEVRRISDVLSTLLAHSIEQHVEILTRVGAPDIVRRTGQLYLYPDETWLRKTRCPGRCAGSTDFASSGLGRADILALEPEVGPDYTIGMFTPDQGMSINPYRQVTAIAADFARRGGRVVRDRVVAIDVEADRCARCAARMPSILRRCGDLRRRMVDTVARRPGLCDAAGEPARLSRHDPVERVRLRGR